MAMNLFNTPVEKSKYRADIDGLRAVAVLVVVFHHLSSRFFPGGYIGVDVFFVISGFLIAGIIHREMLAGTFTFSRFYERRIRRIFPALFAVLIPVLVVGWFVYLPADYLATIKAGLGTVFFSANVVFWRSLQEGYFAADAKQNPLLHMWSLGIEEQFYLFFPVLLLLCLRYAKKYLFLILVTVTVLSLAASAVAVQDHTVAAFFLLPFRAWELAVGCLLAISPPKQPQTKLMREAIALAAIAAIIIPTFFYTTEMKFPGIAALPPVLGSVALIHVGAGERTFVGRLLSTRLAVIIGLLSYSLYLWHWPVIVYWKYLLQVSSLRHWIPLVFAVSLLLAFVSYAFVETPLRRAKKSVGARKVIFAGALSMLPLTIGLSVGILSKGAEGRWSDQVIQVDRVRTAEIPFKNCGRVVKDPSLPLCVIGRDGVEPEILLWGDSHMLAWLPGFDLALKELGASAYIAPVSACPPILYLHSSVSPDCRLKNEAIFARVKNSNIKTIVLAGFWKKYFYRSNILMTAERGGDFDSDVVAKSLKRTILELSDNGKIRVDLLGPVPAYDFDVPIRVANSLAEKKGVAPVVDGNEEHSRNALFYSAVGKFDIKNFSFIDVMPWFCDPACQVYDGNVWYRDAHHLSVHGARVFAPHLKCLLMERDEEVSRC